MARPIDVVMSGLPALQPLPTAAQRAADVIRENVFEGRFAPGSALPEAALAGALQVSRNTVREAFRTLIGEHLLTHEPHRGVMVRRLAADDVRDIYGLRRMLELGAFDLVRDGKVRLDMTAMGELTTTAEQLAQDGRWLEAGTANLRFHEVIAAAHGSVRITEIFRRLMTELRLGFLAAADPATFHGPFLPRNREIHNLLTAARPTEARHELATYLDDAEQAALQAVTP